MMSWPCENNAPKHAQAKVTGISKTQRAFDGLGKFDLDKPTDLLRRRVAAAGAGADEVTE